MARFYGHFAAAYGTIWFCIMLAAVLTQSHINAGEFGLWGFPVIALVYALLRCSSPDSQEAEIEALRKRVRLLESRLPDWTEE
jgi:hypothetical protein